MQPRYAVKKDLPSARCGASRAPSLPSATGVFTNASRGIARGQLLHRIAQLNEDLARRPVRSRYPNGGRSNSIRRAAMSDTGVSL